MKIPHILVTSDLSPESLRPCAPVASLAVAMGARITVLHVAEQEVPILVPPMGVSIDMPIVPPDLPARVAAAREQLESQRGAFEGVEVTTEVMPGFDVVGTVLEYARTNDVDLIAMSTHGRTGFRRLMLGSVAEKMLRHSELPVLVFHQPHEETRGRKSA